MKIAIVGADDAGRSLGAALRSKGQTIVYGIPEPERSDERNAKSVGEAGKDLGGRDSRHALDAHRGPRL
jgi:predicted dinucleotide-binding enzyme